MTSVSHVKSESADEEMWQYRFPPRAAGVCRVKVISLKRYLDASSDAPSESRFSGKKDTLHAIVTAYASALLEMSNCGMAACPALGDELKQNLGKVETSLSPSMNPEEVEASEASVRKSLQGWGIQTARHYQKRAGEIKEMLLVMAHTAESFGARDQRCAGQMHEVTTRLGSIANLEDLAEIRCLVNKSAAELKSSIERMEEEGKAAIEQLREQVTVYQTRLEEADEAVSRDALTGVSSRLYLECQMERRIESGASFCVAMLDIDEFKAVNDVNGHLVGDELLKQFANELRTVCRGNDLIGRWGGDEFLIVLDGGLPEATKQVERLTAWVCGNYTVQHKGSPLKLRVDASIGLAEHEPNEAMKELLARADAAMYQQKGASRGRPPAASRQG